MHASLFKTCVIPSSLYNHNWFIIVYFWRQKKETFLKQLTLIVAYMIIIIVNFHVEPSFRRSIALSHMKYIKEYIL